ncbi:MAG: SPASM domain-containing protein [Bradyrhizobium sp.]
MSQLSTAYELTKDWGLPTLRVSLKLNIGRGTDDCSDSVSNPELWEKAIGHLFELKELVTRNEWPTVELHARPLLGEYLYRKVGLPFFFITCKAATTMIYVNACGECSPCPFESYLPESFLSCLKVRGTMNILEHDVTEIWNSHVFEHYRGLSDPRTNPNKILTGCKHFKSGLCDPCVFTPCTCVSEVAMARSGLKRREHDQKERNPDLHAIAV